MVFRPPWCFLWCPLNLWCYQQEHNEVLGPSSLRLLEIIMEILWRLFLILYCFFTKSGQNFSHVMTAVLSCHVQNFDLIVSLFHMRGIFLWYKMWNYQLLTHSELCHPTDHWYVTLVTPSVSTTTNHTTRPGKSFNMIMMIKSHESSTQTQMLKLYVTDPLGWESTNPVDSLGELCYVNLGWILWWMPDHFNNSSLNHRHIRSSFVITPPYQA